MSTVWTYSVFTLHFLPHRMYVRGLPKHSIFFHSVRPHLVVGRVAEYPLWLVKISNAIFGETKTVSVYCRRSTKGRLLFVLNNFFHIFIFVGDDDTNDIVQPIAIRNMFKIKYY